MDSAAYLEIAIRHASSKAYFSYKSSRYIMKKVSLINLYILYFQSRKYLI